MKTIHFLTIVSIVALAGCDSKQERLRKDNLEHKADALEERANVEKKAGDVRADAIRTEKKDVDAAADTAKRDAEQKAEALKKEADALRDQK